MGSILVIAPHADDEILGCGATIAKHVTNGDTVRVVVGTDASQGAPELYDRAQIDRVRDEALAAHSILGVSDTIFFDFPAPALTTFPSYRISLAFSELFGQIKPDTLYLPFPGDLHDDHRVIYRAALVAARPIGSLKIGNVFCYETLSETEWASRAENATFSPNVYNDVSEFFSMKLDAMKIFVSQLKDFPHSRSLVALDALAKLRGSAIGVPYAESFVLERMIL